MSDYEEYVKILLRMSLEMKALEVRQNKLNIMNHELLTELKTNQDNLIKYNKKVIFETKPSTISDKNTREYIEAVLDTKVDNTKIIYKEKLEDGIYNINITRVNIIDNKIVDNIRIFYNPENNKDIQIYDDNKKLNHNEVNDFIKNTKDDIVNTVNEVNSVNKEFDYQVQQKGININNFDKVMENKLVEKIEQNNAGNNVVNKQGLKI